MVVKVCNILELNVWTIFAVIIVEALLCKLFECIFPSYVLFLLMDDLIDIYIRVATSHINFSQTTYAWSLLPPQAVTQTLVLEFVSAIPIPTHPNRQTSLSTVDHTLPHLSYNSALHA